MDSLTGRLFGPGLAGVGEAATGHWHAGQLHLLTASFSGTLGATPQIVGGGFNGEQLRVTWHAADGAEFVLFVDAGPSSTCFVAGLPSDLQPQVSDARRSQGRTRNRFRLAIAVALVGLMLPLVAVVGLFARSDAVVAWLVHFIPPAYEAKLGDWVLQQTKAQMRVMETGPAVDAVRLIGDKLIPQSVYNYRWLVVDRPEVNAFAAPGGVVVVFAGLVRAADSPEELAGVLAHEVAHAELRHGVQGVVKSLGLHIGTVLLGDATGIVVPGLLTNLLDMKFSREAEMAADEEGLRRLVAAHIDPRPMVTFMAKLAATHKGPSMPALLSTHPSSEERAKRLQVQVLAAKPNWQPLVVDWAAVKRNLK